MVQPPKEEDERIKKERERILTAYKESQSAPTFDTPFEMPLDTKMSSTFGTRRVMNGIKKSPHGGIDLRGNIGKSIKASNRGKVVLTGDLYFTGKTVIIDHGLGMFSLYFHMNKVLKKENDLVEKGEEIGTVGMTGRATGPHLHFGIKLNGLNVNPISLLRLSEDLFNY
ncbi:M23 family metallopeptidase [Thermodesulfobacteriota bacterium]